MVFGYSASHLSITTDPKNKKKTRQRVKGRRRWRKGCWSHDSHILRWAVCMRRATTKLRFMNILAENINTVYGGVLASATGTRLSLFYCFRSLFTSRYQPATVTPLSMFSDSFFASMRPTFISTEKDTKRRGSLWDDVQYTPDRWQCHIASVRPTHRIIKYLLGDSVFPSKP